jgi:subtilisin-like proprotein convertase family protein
VLMTLALHEGRKMIGRMPRIKLLAVASAAAIGLLASTGSAFAGTANYPSTGSFGVPNNTGQAGVPSQAFVPPGRTAVQSLELTKVMPSFGGGGGQDLELRLKSPSGTEIPILSIGCTTYPNTSAFTISDSAATSIDTAAFCSTQLPAGSGKPSQPLSTFNGQPSAGAWTVTVVDVGVSATLGSWNGWTLQINHANPTVTAAKAPFKAKGKIALTATCDADCTVTTGGAAKATTTKLAQNVPGLIVASPTKKAKKKGKGSVTLTATDTTGGKATTTITAKVGK